MQENNRVLKRPYRYVYEVLAIILPIAALIYSLQLLPRFPAVHVRVGNQVDLDPIEGAAHSQERKALDHALARCREGGGC